MDTKVLADNLSTILGQFTPSNLGSRLFMDRDDLETPEKYLIWFHERFHYLQVVFTPYGQLKWGSHRTFSSDVVEYWNKLSKEFDLPKKIPIREYILDNTKDSIKLAYNIFVHDLKNDSYKIVEYGTTTYGHPELFGGLSESTCCPTISLHNQNYRLRGIDILESFAKFEEAMLSELITGKSLDKSIIPGKLAPEYYSALYYFVEVLGPERLIEFPVVCELSLATPHTPLSSSIDNFYHNAPNWRFIKIIETIKDAKNLPAIDFNDDKTFYEYSNAVLNACGYETFDDVWTAAEEYANMSDLTMAKEMKAAIEYKKKHPWMLSYPMCNFIEFISSEFNRFAPYYTIMEDGVSYNTDKIQIEEFIFENHLQALANQICGYGSKYSLDSHKIMCGYAYMGINMCPHCLNGECDGHIDCNTQLPTLILDEKSNIVNGCTFCMVLKGYELDIKDISIGFMQSITYDDIINAVDNHFSEQK